MGFNVLNNIMLRGFPYVSVSDESQIAYSTKRLLHCTLKVPYFTTTLQQSLSWGKKEMWKNKVGREVEDMTALF